MSTEKEEYEKAQKVVRKYEQKQKQAKENCVSFNINHYILVKLRETGYKHWMDDMNKYMPKAEKMFTIEDLSSRADDEGFVQFQMHEFMQIFGGTIHMGGTPLFDTNVRFYKTEIKEY